MNHNCRDGGVPPSKSLFSLNQNDSGTVLDAADGVSMAAICVPLGEMEKWLMEAPCVRRVTVKAFESIQKTSFVPSFPSTTAATPPPPPPHSHFPTPHP